MVGGWALAPGTGQAQFQTHGAADHVGQALFNTVAVLSTNPVQLEAVTHIQNRQHALGALIGQLGGGQRCDPGAVLLLGQLGGQALAGQLPEGGTHCG